MKAFSMTNDLHTSVLAIGGGPANLSLAALGDSVEDLDINVVELRDSVAWHPGLLCSNSRLQVSGVKDLVSLVDPRSRYSFLNFLCEEGRIYRHLIANSTYVSRKEFDQYFRWAADLLGVHTSEGVKAVDHDGSEFVVHTNRRRWHARDLVLGVGQEPFLPPCVRGVRGEHLWHASQYLHEAEPVAGRDVLLVGGGQSAGEVALDILSGRTGFPRSFAWITGAAGFTPLDDSPFTNEWFNPTYVEHFRQIPGKQRAELLQKQKVANRGITTELLKAIYKRLYELDYLDQEQVGHRLLAGTEISQLRAEEGVYRATLENRVTRSSREVSADYVVMATGFRSELPEFMSPLFDRLPVANGEYRVEEDYSISWRGPARNRIYVQNAACSTHGVADPNLSLAAWRSAVIVNSIVGREFYPLRRADITLSLES